MRYTKQYSSPAELLTILKSRGLDYSETMNAEQILRSIGYYRLSGYLYPFLKIPKTNHIYKRGSTLNGALSLYEFDREFRLLVFNQIERIEIAVRSAITNILCAETNDVFWISSPSYFANTAQNNSPAHGADKLFINYASFNRFSRAAMRLFCDPKCLLIKYEFSASMCRHGSHT